jgi:hypothetical protein
VRRFWIFFSAWGVGVPPSLAALICADACTWAGVVFLNQADVKKPARKLVFQVLSGGFLFGRFFGR